MTREQMMDEVIRMLGFEHKWTIWFCGLCENQQMSDSACEMAMITVLALGQLEMEEDEE